jgi:hypothetical protein
MGHASLASCGGGGVSRVGTERASLARCGGRGVSGVSAGMGHVTPEANEFENRKGPAACA